jgi:hypothetical protein
LVGDAHEALAETVIESFKTELIRQRGPDAPSAG